MILLLLLWGTSLWLGSITESPVVRVTAQPQSIYIEQGTFAQLLNFDLIVENLSDKPLVLKSIEVSVFDQKDELILRRFVDDNGSRPSIQTVGNRELGSRQIVLVFNPFYEFSSQVDLHKMRYEVLFSDHEKQEYKAEVVIFPVVYMTKTDLALPVKDRMIVYDGHDFYAHHRRFDYQLPALQQLGFRSNFMRYSYDFVPVNKAGEMFKGREEDNANWFGFGVDLYAAGSGRVVAVVDSHADNRSFDMAALATNRMELFGNYLVIDHLNGEYSLYGHIKQGSSKVRVGEQVKQGQVIAQMGASGSSKFPHLHYELQTGADTSAEGLPSYFKQFRRILGSRSIEIKKGQVDTGDILESK